MGNWGQCLENGEKFVYTWFYPSFGFLDHSPCLLDLPVSATFLPKSAPIISVVMKEFFQLFMRIISFNSFMVVVK